MGQDRFRTIALAVALLLGGEGAVLHLAVVGPESAAHHGSHLGEALDELGLPLSHAQHILPDQHLPVAAAAGADADGDDVQLPGDEGGQLGGHALQHHHKSPCFLDGQGILQDLPGSVFSLALDLEAPHGVAGLGGHPHVGAYRDAAGGDGPDPVADRRAPFQLHGVGAGLLHQPAGVGHRLLHGDLIAHKGHVHHHEGGLAGPGHAAAVDDHLLHGDGEGVRIALHGHAQAVPHQDGVDAGLIHEAGGGVVVAGQLGDVLPSGLLLRQGKYGVFLHWFDPPISARMG